MVNRVERKDGYCELLLLKNRKQKLIDKEYAKVSAEDYNKIKNMTGEFISLVVN
ncbi:hypothetical protein [Methanobrevibacter arboriphilus]|uniref:hypothetical protein n=1 Tax=Methanobrevibacter arboriphilus TaxID=39441 RepID=UPI000A79F992|nr:hypothetical protein [Methanobrevibacter arboriphilus]